MNESFTFYELVHKIDPTYRPNLQTQLTDTIRYCLVNIWSDNVDSMYETPLIVESTSLASDTTPSSILILHMRTHNDDAIICRRTGTAGILFCFMLVKTLYTRLSLSRTRRIWSPQWILTNGMFVYPRLTLTSSLSLFLSVCGDIRSTRIFSWSRSISLTVKHWKWKEKHCLFIDFD